MSTAQGFLLRMPAGIPGECTRGWGNSIIETQVITPSGTTGAPMRKRPPAAAAPQ